MDFKEKLAILFEVTYSGKSTAELNDAQKTLSDLSCDPGFLKALFEIISDSNKNPEIKARLKLIKKSATLYLKRHIDEKLESDEIKHDEIYFFSQIVCNGLYHQHVTIDNKIQLLIMLNKLMLNDLTRKVLNDLRSKVLQDLTSLNSLDQDLTSLNKLEHYQKVGVSLVIRAILGTLNQAIEISSFFNEIKTDLFRILRSLTLFNTSDFKVLLRQLKVLKVWVETFRNFAIKLADLRSSAMECMITVPDVAGFSFEVCKLTFPMNQQLDECMVSTTSSTKLNELLNDIKKKTLKLVNVMMAFLIETRSQKASKSSLLELIPFLMELIYKSLIRYFAAMGDTFSGISENNTLEGLIIQALIFMRQVCELNEHYTFFQMNYQVIFFDILLPLMTANHEERSLFSEKPEKFLSFTLECSAKKEKENLKSAVCFLTQVMARFVDGFLTFAFGVMKESLVFSIISNNPSEIEANPQSYPSLKQFSFYKSVFLHKTSQETRVETSLLFFSVLHEEIHKRDDLKNSLECLITNHEEALLNKQNTTEFIRSRVCLLFGFYGNVLFLDHSNPSINHIFCKFLKFVVNSIKSKKKITLAVTYLAIDSLLKTIFSSRLKNRNAPLIQDIFKVLVAKLPKISYPQFYDLIATILKNFKKTLKKHCSESLLVLFRSLVNLILSRLSKFVKKQRKKGLLLSKSFDILEEIIDSKALSPSMMEEELLILYENLENPNKIRLEREMFALIAKMIEAQGVISPALEKLFPVLPRCFRIIDFEMRVVLHVLNYYLYYGKGFVGSNMKTLEQIIELTIYTILGNEDKTDDYNQALGALILQAVILNYHEILGVDFWNTVFFKLAVRMDIPFGYKFLKGSICNIIWASFYTKFDLMQEILVKCDKLVYFLQFLIQDHSVYTTVYDKKLMILGACAIFNSCGLEQTVVDYSWKIMDLMVANLKVGEDSKKKSKKFTNQIVTENENIDSSDVLEDLDAEEDSESDNLIDNKLVDSQLEYAETVKNLYSFVNKVDEFEYFQKTISELKIRNFTFLQNVVGLLPEQRKHELKDILQSKRVNLEENNSVPRKIFRVIGIKKQ